MCARCHGNYRSNNYTSLTDGQNWGNLHDVHRSALSFDCDACHLASDKFPVNLDQSAGGTGLDPIGCMGCHGRDEDNVAANPRTGHPDIPSQSCNDDGSENFAGAPAGLDNDGDQSYDGDDPDCGVSAVPGQQANRAMLLQNHPNPFNPSTHIKYVLQGPGHVLLQVFTIDGELVQTLVNAHHDQAMTYQVIWDGRNSNGRPMPRGIFFYRLETPVGVEMKKMVLLK